jgi:hypothetical protein
MHFQIEFSKNVKNYLVVSINGYKWHQYGLGQTSNQFLKNESLITSLHYVIGQLSQIRGTWPTCKQNKFIWKPFVGGGVPIYCQ